MTSTAPYWEVFDKDLPLVGAIYSGRRVRMLALGLRGGGLCVVSPGSGLSEEQFTALERWGRPRFLLAPNHFHNGGLAPWQARYPEAKVVAHPRAMPRLQRKFPGLNFSELEPLTAALPEGTQLLSPPMAKQGELWVSARTGEGIAWYVVDGFLNEWRLPKGPVGWLMRGLGFRPGLMMNPFFKRLFLESKASFQAWVKEQLARDQPTLLIPSHGVVLRGPEVSRQLYEATEAG
jgi:hypothetical protein